VTGAGPVAPATGVARTCPPNAAGAASCLDFPAIAAHMRCIPPGPAKRPSLRLWGAPAEYAS